MVPKPRRKRRQWHIPWLVILAFISRIPMTSWNTNTRNQMIVGYGHYTSVNGNVIFCPSAVSYEALQEQNYFLTNIITNQIYANIRQFQHYTEPTQQKFDHDSDLKRRASLGVSWSEGIKPHHWVQRWKRQVFPPVTHVSHRAWKTVQYTTLIFWK